ncbi:MAG: phosphate acetyltransferase [Candidatus Omnitrophica bacterium]|nr:phosphate acetyltransferase [Candidatus Omnitrophota bacterium]MBU4487651.1 phosphate acetyltransferase [Candidatus Omnitrophota bacterium]MCG2705420.1 phosphate acetyltransferase [Candidatus Omnitrophota bacterium]
MDPIKFIRDKAKKNLKTIVLSEPADPRVLEAAVTVAKGRIAKIIFLGDVENTRKSLRKFGEYDEGMIKIIDPKTSEMIDKLAKDLSQKRHNRYPDEQSAKKILLDNYVFFGAMMVANGLADGFVAGASHKTSDVARAAIHCLEVDESIGVASGSFLMYIENSHYGDNGLFVFADCGLLPDPNPRQLAGIAVSSAELYRRLFDKEPYVAMLSYSTKSSAQGQLVDKVKKGVEEARVLAPDILIDGELQADSALDYEVANIKTSMKDSAVAGKANVLIFPNLDSGNISYKLVQRLTNARAIGPILQGLKKPASDLSRGCIVDDVIDAIAITAVRAQ